MDVESLPIVERDAVYKAAVTKLLPAALEQFGEEAPFDELVHMAAIALQRYEGRVVADFEIRLANSHSWRTDSSFFNMVGSFLIRSLDEGVVQIESNGLHKSGSRLLDLTSFDEEIQRSALILLRDKLVLYVHEVGPVGSVILSYDEAKARSLASVAGEVMAAGRG